MAEKPFDDTKMIREILPYRIQGEKPLALVRTYGCQQNVSDGEKIKGMLEKMGYGFTEEPEKADFILFNTCAVREHAEDRIFGNVGALKHYKRRHPSLIIALCGCMMEQEHVANRIYQSYPFVSLVFGTHSLSRFPKLVYETMTGEKRVFERGIEDNSIDETIPVRRDGALKAWLPIMYGCDNFCSYCVVPYVRGRERSREKSAVLAEANALIGQGYRDITLLGQNVNSYGKNLQEPANFAGLLQEISGFEGDYWLRFMTSHPKDCTKELLDVMAESDHIAKHLHLPFQSGNNRVLKAMNRRYTREQYLEIVRYAREKMPDLSLTSDVIVGFPGETEEEFQDTLSLIREVEFTSLYTFIFSPRKGTPAEKMPDPVSREEKNRWFSELLKVQEEISARRCAAMIGTQVLALVEEETAKPGIYHARTGGNVSVEVKAEPQTLGTFQKVQITEAGNWVLKGICI